MTIRTTVYLEEEVYRRAEERVMDEVLSDYRNIPDLIVSLLRCYVNGHYPEFDIDWEKRRGARLVKVGITLTRGLYLRLRRYPNMSILANRLVELWLEGYIR